MQIPFIPFATHTYTFSYILATTLAIAFRRLNREDVNRLDDDDGGGDIQLTAPVSTTR